MPESYYLQFIGSFLLLGVILYGLMRGSKAVQLKRYTGDIQVVDRKVVDAGTTLLIIEVRGSQYLVSSSGKTVQLLKELS